MDSGTHTFFAEQPKALGRKGTMSCPRVDEAAVLALPKNQIHRSVQNGR